MVNFTVTSKPFDVARYCKFGTDGQYFSRLMETCAIVIRRQMFHSNDENGPNS